MNPRNTLASVVLELSNGLADGSILLHHDTHSSRSPYFKKPPQNVAEVVAAEILRQKSKQAASSNLRRQAFFGFLLVADGSILVATITLFFLQGFHAWGFSLDETVLKWLGAAMIGEFVGLLYFTFTASFVGGRKSSEEPGSW